MTHDVVDYVIVGGGLAGLYYGYLLRTHRPSASFLILEAESHFGGRAFDVRFGSLTVPAGAGLGRFTQDRLLRTLMTDLGLPVETFPVRHAYSPRIRPVDIPTRFTELKRALATSTDDASRVSFRTLARAVWGPAVYEDFLRFNGYRDMEREDARETLSHYHIQDNYTRWTAFRVRWNDLTRTLCAAIGPTHLRTRQPVHAITRATDGTFRVKTRSVWTYTCRHVILACPIPVVQRLLPQHSSLYQGIGVQPFLRTYVQFDPASAAIVQRYIPQTTVVSNALQKIIPMDAQRGVYMIAYADNRNAVAVRALGPKALAAAVVREFRIPESLRIVRLRHCFWQIGTHYYRPLSVRFASRVSFRRQAQAPEPGIRVIGESVSTNQGWVEGALETARAAFFSTI